MAELLRLVADHRRRADFAFVYLREAHPADEQDFGPGQAVPIETHAGLEERAAAARWLAEREGVELSMVLLDEMGDGASAAFNAFPDRLAIVQGDVLRYISGPGPFGFNVDEVREWLEKNA